MKRKLLIVMLAGGTLVGFGSGFAHLRHHSQHHRKNFELRVAKVCAEAALDATGPRGSSESRHFHHAR